MRTLRISLISLGLLICAFFTATIAFAEWSAPNMGYYTQPSASEEYHLSPASISYDGKTKTVYFITGMDKASFITCSGIEYRGKALDIKDFDIKFISPSIASITFPDNYVLLEPNQNIFRFSFPIDQVNTMHDSICLKNDMPKLYYGHVKSEGQFTNFGDVVHDYPRSVKYAFNTRSEAVATSFDSVTFIPSDPSMQNCVSIAKDPNANYYDVTFTNECTGMIKAVKGSDAYYLPVNISLPGVGIYSENNASVSNLVMGKTVSYTGSEMTLYAIKKPDINFSLTTCSSIVIYGAESESSKIKVEMLNSSSASITIPASLNLGSSNRTVGFTFKTDNLNNEEFYVIINLQNDVNGLTYRFIRSDNNQVIIAKNSDENYDNLRKQVGNNDMIVFYEGKVSNLTEPVQLKSISFTPDAGTAKSAVTVAPVPNSPYYNINYNQLGAGTITAEGQECTYSFRVSCVLPDFGFYSDADLRIEHSLVGSGENIAIASLDMLTDNTLYFGSIVGQTITEFVPDERNPEVASAMSISMVGNSIVKIVVDESKLEGYYNELGFIYRYNSEQRIMTSHIDLNLISPNQLPRDMIGSYSSDNLVSKGISPASVLFGQTRHGMILSEDGWMQNVNTTFKYKGTEYRLCVANYTNDEWKIITNTGAGSDGMRETKFIVAPWVFSEVAGTYIPVSDSLMSEMINSGYQFELNMYATKEYDGVMPAIYVYNGEEIQNKVGVERLVLCTKDSCSKWVVEACMSYNNDTYYTAGILGYALNETKYYYVNSDANNIEGINKEIAAIVKQESDSNVFLHIVLPLGTIDGRIVVPSDVDSSLDAIFFRGVTTFTGDRMITICGGLDNYSEGAVQVNNINFIGNKEYVGHPALDAIKGQIIPENCSFSNFDVAMSGDIGLVWGAHHCEFINNRIAIYINTSDECSGGDYSLTDCRFVRNDIALWVEYMPDRLGQLYSTRGLVFENNTIDIVNRDNSLLWLNRALFYHGELNQRGEIPAYTKANEEYYLPVLTGKYLEEGTHVKHFIQKTMITLLAKDESFNDFFLPNYEKAAIVLDLSSMLADLNEDAPVLHEDMSGAVESYKQALIDGKVDSENARLYIAKGIGVPKSIAGKGAFYFLELKTQGSVLFDFIHTKESLEDN